ncbi:hypothetical protein [Arthrobacter sp. MYb227]|uniref:hypothetical protein n=1 Tax=Arthrobacter sp. MYb227 TaxID=1848601 RepID=UPI0015E2764B|nr:hypothetical protein [Arthrobacter sp. MYb227]
MFDELLEILKAINESVKLARAAWQVTCSARIWLRARRVERAQDKERGAGNP